MILDALEHDCYKDKIQRPQTKRFIRDIYRELREKLKRDEQLSQEIKESVK